MGLEPEEFSMFMRSGQDTIHTYTSTEEHSQPECSHVYGIKDLYDQYPALVELPADRLKYGKFLALKATLVLHKPEQMKKGCDLGILFALCGRPMYQPPSVVCYTKLYNNGMRIVHTNDVIRTVGEGAHVKPDADKVDVVELQNGNIQYAVPFRSTFWAASLYRLANIAYEADTLAANPSAADAHERVQSLRHEVSASISNITAVQELVATHPLSNTPQTVLTILWSFQQAAEGHDGLTTRRILEISELLDEFTPNSTQPTTMKSESFDSLDVYDFSQPVEPYYGSSATLQSPIQFPTDSTTWTPPGCSDLGVPSYSDTTLHCSNEIDFTGGHVALTFDDSQHSQQPLPQSFDTGVTSALNLDMTLSDMPTDPILLSQYRPWTTNAFEGLFDTTNTSYSSDTAFHAPVPTAAVLPSQHDNTGDSVEEEMDMHVVLPTHGQFEVAYRSEFGDAHAHHQAFAGASASEAEMEQHRSQEDYSKMGQHLSPEVDSEVATEEIDPKGGQQQRQQTSPQVIGGDGGHGCTRCAGLRFCVCVSLGY